MDLQLQLKVFEEHRDEDFYEFAQRFDNIRMDLDDTVECFEVLRNSVVETPSEPFLLSILQHLLFIRDDPNVKSVLLQKKIINKSSLLTSLYSDLLGFRTISSSKSALLKLSYTRAGAIPIFTLQRDSKLMSILLSKPFPVNTGYCACDVR